MTRENKEARNKHEGEVLWFTDISSPYEAPEQAEVVVDTGSLSLAVYVEQVIAYLQNRGVIKI